MASFRIHEDQENRRPEIRQKEAIKNTLQQRRQVLGALDNKPAQLATKPKQLQSRKPVPVVPVAQFEAFKVYEDKPEEKKNDKKTLKSKLLEKEEPLNEHVINLPKPVQSGKQCPSATPMSEGSIQGSPMSVDKSLVLCNNRNKPVKTRQEREIFFEVHEYRRDIHKYLRESELRNRPKSGYMKKQPDITYSMRTILVDWLVEVAEEYRLQTETLYLAVSYIDRFLSYMSVVRAKLQLVGTAAMFIASKYEEIYPPDVGEFVYITDDTYNKKQVLRMEQLILKVLAFDLSIPTPLSFLTKFSVASEQGDKIMHLAMYLCELSMLEADPYLQFLPSMLAASAIALSRDTLELEPWTSELEDITGYSYKHLQACIKYLYNAYSSASSLQQQAIQEKYKTSKYQHVALLLPRTDNIDLKENEERPKSDLN